MFVRDEGPAAARVSVLVHGLGASSRVFDAVFAQRRPDERLIALDLPRTGRSKQYARSEPQAVSGALLAELTRRRVERFSLFGHSFGGLVALSVALTAPHRLDRLVVASAPALGLPPEVAGLLDNPLADWSMSVFGRFPVFRPALQAYLDLIRGPRARMTPAQLTVFEEALGAEGFAEGMLEAMRSVSRFRLETEPLRTAPFSRVVLWGEKDPLVSVIQGERLSRAIDATLTVVHDVGHCLPDEAPEAVLTALRG
jgi:pimeloyl-ACP methyl ester carboxylesterase